MPSKKLLLIDGNAIAYRAFYALPPLRSSRGEPVSATYGFTTMLLKAIEGEKPDFIAAAFDLGPPTFRLEKFPAYKAQRAKMPEDLAPQLKRIRELLAVLGIPVFYREGYEADDCLGSLAKKAEQEGYQVLLLSGDLDLLQLVSDKINVLTTRKGISQLTRYNPEKVAERYGLSPGQMVDMKALAGDASDNVPGVSGIGEVTAQKLLKQHQSLEGLFANLEKLPEKIKNTLLENKEKAFLARELVKIKDDLDLKPDFAAYRFKGLENPEAQELFRELEFKFALRPAFPKAESPPLAYQVIEEAGLSDLLTGLKTVKAAAFYLPRLKEEIKGLGIALDSKAAYFLPLNFSIKEEELGPLFSQDKKKGILSRVLKSLFLLPLLTGYDLKGSLALLEPELPEGISNLFDVKLSAYLLDPEENLSLPELFRRYLSLNPEDFTLKKELSPEEVYTVSARSTAGLLELKTRLEEKLKECKLEELFTKVELPLLLLLYKMESRGIKIDLAYLSKLSRELEIYLLKLEEQAFQLTGEKFNLNSPRQVAEVLFNKLKLSPLNRTKTGFSTGFEVLTALKGEHQVIEVLLAQREVAKLKSTYVDALSALVSPKDQRLHTSFNQMITATGRLSSSEPNLQNIPIRTELGRKIRRAFIPEKGFKLMGADYSQIELRVLAHLCGDPNLKEAFAEGKDIHNITAAGIFGVGSGEITPEMRRKAKEVNFGIIYGMGPHGLAQRLGIKRGEAKEFIAKYFQHFAGVKEYIEKLLELARKSKEVYTILGRKRYIPQLNSQNFALRSAAERMAVNTPIQGSAADLIKLAMLMVEEEIGKNFLKGEVKMLLQIHDELIFEVKEEFLLPAKNLVKEIMEQVYPLAVPLVAEVKAGENWEIMKEI